MAKPTTASAWSDDELVTLPSGKRARLRRKAQMYAALRDGAITVEILRDWQAVQRSEIKDPARAMALQDAVIAWLFVEPRCVTNGSVPDGAIHVSMLEDEDLDFLIARAFGGAPEDATFPEPAGLSGDSGGAASGGDGEGVAEKPKRAARARAGDAQRVPRRQPSRGKAAGARTRSRPK